MKTSRKTTSFTCLYKVPISDTGAHNSVARMWFLNNISCTLTEVLSYEIQSFMHIPRKERPWKLSLFITTIWLVLILVTENTVSCIPLLNTSLFPLLFILGFWVCFCFVIFRLVFIVLETRNNDLKLFCRVKCSTLLSSSSLTLKREQKSPWSSNLELLLSYWWFLLPPSSVKLLIKCWAPFERLNSASCQLLQLWKMSPIYFNCLLSGGSNQMTVIWEVFPIRAMSLDSLALSAIPYTSDNEEPDN